MNKPVIYPTAVVSTAEVFIASLNAMQQILKQVQSKVPDEAFNFYADCQDSLINFRSSLEDLKDFIIDLATYDFVERIAPVDDTVESEVF